MLQLSLKTHVNHKHLKMFTIFLKNLLSQSTMTRAHTYDTMVLFQPHNEPYLPWIPHNMVLGVTSSIQLCAWAGLMYTSGHPVILQRPALGFIEHKFTPPTQTVQKVCYRSKVPGNILIFSDFSQTFSTLFNLCTN